LRAADQQPGVGSAPPGRRLAYYAQTGAQQELEL